MVNQEEKRLNKEQKEAVEHGGGPLLIIAGAGTGKTTVITERIKWLIASEKCKASEILALTFTEKASREMEERVDIAMPYGYTDMWISTFHSFCDRVLRQEAIHIGLNPAYKLMREAETIQFLIGNLFKFDLEYFRPLGNPNKFISGMIQHFSRLKDEDVAPNEYLHWAREQRAKSPSTALRVNKEQREEFDKYQELAKAYQMYEELKIKEGLMDFGDLITNILKLFRTRKNVLGEYQEKFKYLLVDEYQDTNIAQNELVILLAGPRANLTVVADDDQSIYKWRGAAISNVIQFRKHFPKAKIITLTKNYRSTQKILDSAYQLIQNNNPDRLEVKEKVDKKLKSVREVMGEKIEFIHTDRVENEAEMVAKKIRELVFTGSSVANDPGSKLPSALSSMPYAYSDFAILVRANNHAEPFVRALERAGIPYQFLGPGQLFRQSEIKDLIAYLKVLYNFEDNVAWYRVLSMDYFDISARDLAAINNYGRRINLSLFEACEQVEKVFVSEKTKEKINWLVKMVHRHLKLISKETAGQILYYFLEDTGLLKKMADYQTVAEEKSSQNIAKFFDRLKTYEVDHEDASVLAVVDWINLSMDLGESPLANNYDWVSENKVNILTVHSAKGLEFPIVFLVNLVMERFPTRARQEQIPIPEELIKEILPSGDHHQQEERRLFYVGTTRACDRLFLTAANYYGEGKREKKLSPFVMEAMGKLANQLVSQTASQPNQLSIFGWEKLSEEKVEGTIPYNLQPITYLSYSQIDTFNTCPRQYRFKYIQRIPVPSSAAAGFGNSMHKTLRDFYLLVKKSQKPSQKDLLELLDKNWSAEGYASRTHEQKMKKQGQRMLTDFYQKAYDANQKPLALEQPFVIKVSSSLKIGGRIDRVEEQAYGLEIIDYKTGKAMEQKDIDKSLQMTVYALAAVDPGIYRQNPQQVTLTFYFLDKGEKRSTRRTEKQLVEAKKELIEKAKEIEKSDFKPTPGIWCGFCDFKLLCEAWS